MQQQGGEEKDWGRRQAGHVSKRVETIITRG